ncbi:MAG: DivIVA domain-containing protein [Pseudomonadota bacterium]
MKITPLDIQQQQFKITLRGYDTKDVDVFMEMVSSELEKVIRENNEIKDKQTRLTNQLEEFKDKEKILKDTIIAAQKISEDMKENAKKEGDIIIAQAESQADMILEKAYSRLAKVIEDINEMKRQRIQYETSLKSLLYTHIKILNAKKSEEESELNDEQIETNLKVMKQSESK